MLAISDPNPAPRLLPLTVALTALIWIVATTGGRQILVKEILGEAYDSQAEHFLRGDPGVDMEAIQSEAMIVDGKVRMYFGPFPAFLRVPLNFVYPAGWGRWSRLSGFCAGAVALCAFAGLLRQTLRSAPLSVRTRNWLANACLLGFALGSPLLYLLGNLSIFSEAIIWGLAWSVAALFFAYRARTGSEASLTAALFAFSVCAAGALLSRVTFGAPLLLIVPILALSLPRQKRLVHLAALILPAAAGVAFYFLLNYAKFGTLLGMTYDYYINSTHREFARQHGIFNLLRVPSSFADYFSLHFPSFRNTPPFLHVDRHFLAQPALYSLPFSETFLSVLWSSSWLVLGAILGLALLFQTNGADAVERWMAAALFIQFIGILSYFALAQRYAADLYPFLVFCLLIFLRWGGIAFLRIGMIGLVAFSVLINSLATASWLARDSTLPAETRLFWNAVAGGEMPQTSGGKK